VIESLFFRTYNSYLLGNEKDTVMFFHFLSEEYKKRRDSKALTRGQLKILKSIHIAIKSGTIQICQWIKDTEIIPVDSKSNSPIKQKDLVYKIHTEGLHLLKKILKAPKLELYDIEHLCSPYGAVDMVYKNDDIIYPLEVKIHEGKHDLVGQISKYTLSFKLKLNLKFYTEVQPVTLCNSYNSYTLMELKKLGVIPLRYNFIKDKIEIRGVF
jgi:hypothetical protein